MCLLHITCIICIEQCHAIGVIKNSEKASLIITEELGTYLCFNLLINENGETFLKHLLGNFNQSHRDFYLFVAVPEKKKVII